MKILILMLARGVGGLERRTATAYKYIATNFTDCEILFLVNKAQVALIEDYSCEILNKKCQRVVFGIPYRNPYLTGHYIYYLIDYFLLLIKLLQWFPFKKFQVAYFTKFSILPLRKLIRSKQNFFAFVDSNTPERVLHSKVFLRITKENFLIDCLSEDLQKKAINYLGIKNDIILYSPCSFIDYSKTSVKPKKKIISFVSRFSQGKGVELLLSALPIIVTKHPDIYFNILGYGMLQKSIIDAIEEKFINRVNVLFTPNPSLYLQESLVFLSLQEKENYPSQSLLEAMACGNAVIATDVGLTKKIVTPDVGLCISATPKSLVEAIEYLLSNIEKTSMMGIAARRKVMSEHTIEKYINYIRKKIV